MVKVFQWIPQRKAHQCKETRHNLIAHHGVSLPRACLAIGKHTCIDTFKCSFEDIRAQIFIDLKLEKKSHMILMYAKTGKSKHQGKPIKNTFSWEANEGLFLSAESYEKSYENTFSSYPGGVDDGWKALNAVSLNKPKCFNIYKC